MSAPGEIRLLLCGDVMLGRGIDQILPHPGAATLQEQWRDVASAQWFVERAQQRNGPIPAQRDTGYVWGDALAAFDALAPDVRLINLETAITARGEPLPGKRIHYRMSPANVAVLQRARIDCCALANNHVMDFGPDGLADTVASLRDVGIASAGAGADRTQAQAPAGIGLPGRGRVLVFSLATPCSFTPPRWQATADKPGVNLVELDEISLRSLQRQIAETRQPDDLVVVSIHWGPNWGYAIDPGHRRFARRLVDEAGVDLVHGHSAHHVRGIELHAGKPILYGCGDLINDYEGIPRRPVQEQCLPDLGLIYLARFAASDRRLLGLEMVPTRIRHLRIERADDHERRLLCEMLNREGRLLGTRFVEERGGIALASG